jgi:hypothetical protein
MCRRAGMPGCNWALSDYTSPMGLRVGSAVRTIFSERCDVSRSNKNGPHGGPYEIWANRPEPARQNFRLPSAAYRRDDVAFFEKELLWQSRFR